MSNCTRISNTY